MTSLEFSVYGYGISAATGIGVAGAPIGVITLGGANRSTDMYRHP